MGAAAVVVGTRFGARVRSVPVGLTLGWMVGASALVRFLFALRRPTITYLPDEYTYAELARGIAQTGRPVIRGSAAHFPALLEPLLAAPFWLGGNPAVAFRLTQAESAIVMSLAAIPIYLLARRLALGRGLALACAAVTLVSPNLLYVSYLTADPIAYPLVLGAVYAGVVALESESRNAQAAFVALAGLASFARLQYLLLFPVLLAASVLVSRGDTRRLARSVGLVAAVVAAGAVVAFALGPVHLLGNYGLVLHLHASAPALAHQLRTDSVLLPFSAGIVLVPGALVGLARGVFRSLSTTEQAFTTVTVVLGLGLMSETVLIGTTISATYIERYLICVFPLLTPAFCLYARRGGAVISTLFLSAGLALLAILVPLSGYTAGGGWIDSTFLFAVSRLEQVGGTGTGTLIASLLALALAVTAGFVALRPTRRAGLAIGLTIGTLAAVSTAATSWGVSDSRSARDLRLAPNVRWVDAAGLAGVTLVETPGGNVAGGALEQLFWNVSVAGVVLLPGAVAIDPFAAPKAAIAPDGELLVNGAKLAGPILIDDSRSWVGLSGARLVRAAGDYRLLRPNGPVRISIEVVGLLPEGRLGPRGSIIVWPGTSSRRLTVHLALPKGSEASTISFRRDSRTLRSFYLHPGQHRIATFVIPAHSRMKIDFVYSHLVALSDGRFLGLVASRPRLSRIDDSPR